MPSGHRASDTVESIMTLCRKVVILLLSQAAAVQEELTLRIWGDDQLRCQANATPRHPANGLRREPPSNSLGKSAGRHCISLPPCNDRPKMETQG